MVHNSSAVRLTGFLILGWIMIGCSGGDGPLKIGSQLPNFTVSAAGSYGGVSLADLKGKPVLIDFWATWCGPCKMAMPHLQGLWKKYQPAGLQVLCVSADSASEISAYQAENGIQMPMYIDADKKMNNAFGINALPTTIVLGKDGRVIYSVDGTGPDVEKELDAAVAQAVL